MYSTPTTLGVPSQDLLHVGTQRDIWSPLKLEALRDTLRRQARDERAKDRMVSLADTRFEFDDCGAAFVRFRGRSRFGRRRLMTAHAVKQVASLVGTQASLAMLQDLVHGGEQADLKLASRVLQRLALRSDSDRKLRFRTAIRHCQPGGRQRIVTAVLSDRYRPYDDAEFVAELVERIPKSDKLPVLSAWRTSEAFSLRMSLSPDEPEMCQPFPMVEFRNSEVGAGSTTLSSGLFTLICTNGMHNWDDHSVYRWPHRGDPTRVREGVVTALAQAQEQATVAQNDYLQAGKIVMGDSAEDIDQWLSAQSRRLRLSGRFIRGVLEALEHPTTSRAEGGAFSLASVVDAVTLYAQQAPFDERHDMERLAGRFLEEGTRHRREMSAYYAEMEAVMADEVLTDVPF
jgi:hypothetical protein